MLLIHKQAVVCWQACNVLNSTIFNDLKSAWRLLQLFQIFLNAVCRKLANVI